MGVIGAELQRDEDRDVDKEFDGARGFQTLPCGKEATMGRRVLDGGLLRQHGRKARRGGDSWKVCEQRGKEYQKRHADYPLAWF